MTRIHFTHPWFLLLAVVPAILLALDWMTRKSLTRSVPFSGCDLLSAQGRSRRGISTAVNLMRCLALLALIPIAGGIEASVARPDRARDSALVIVLDISSSMTADDFSPAGRLEEAKKHLQTFIAGVPATELGVVVFAGTPRLVMPVTSDHEAVRRAISGIEAVGYGEDGTAIGTALASAINRLRNASQPRREILLITDGVNNSGAVAPLDAARLARALGIKVNAVGMGGDSPSRYWVPTADGTPFRMQARIDIDEKTLEQAARETGGSYARARTSGELYRALASLRDPDPGSSTLSLFEDHQRLNRICALLSLGLICSGFVLSEFICPELPG